MAEAKSPIPSILRPLLSGPRAVNTERTALMPKSAAQLIAALAVKAFLPINPWP